MSLAMRIAAHEYRRQMSRRELTQTEALVLDCILFFSLERVPDPQTRAVFPRQSDIGEFRGIDEADLSRTIKYLVKQQVIEVDGTSYGLRPPSGWTLPRRVIETALLLEKEKWLEKLLERGESEPNLPALQPDATLSAAMQSTFIENAAAAAAAAAVPLSVPVSVPVPVHVVGNSPTPQSAPVTVAAAIGTGAEYRAYVEQRLFSCISQEERFGRSRELWFRALELVPEEVDELVSVALEKRRLGNYTKTKSRNPAAAWLNVAVREALSLQGGRPRTGPL